MTERPNAVCYRWADLPTDRPMDRLQRRRIIGEQAMISEVLLEQGWEALEETLVIDIFSPTSEKTGIG